jgi:citrate lyase subunit beta / citryl-CoA lyase
VTSKLTTSNRWSNDPQLPALVRQLSTFFFHGVECGGFSARFPSRGIIRWTRPCGRGHDDRRLPYVVDGIAARWNVMDIARARSWLFVPGDRPALFAKAAASGADAVVLDLEDAVAPAEKAGARAEVARYTAGHPAWVRINAAGTEFHEADAAALAAARGLLGVMLPKAGEPQEIARAVRRLPADLPVVALVETAWGVENAARVAAHPAVARLAFGSVDFGLDIGVAGDGEEMLYARSRLVVASRAAGIAAPLDGVTTDLDDPGRTAADARRARRLGFGGKLCVHPRQVEPVNAAFRPGADDVRWAERVVAAMDASGGRAVRVDGRMADIPVLESARAILRAAGDCGAVGQ